MKKILLVSLLGLLPSLLSNEIRDTQDKIMAWIETQKSISETKAEWIEEKAVVEDLIALLEQKKASFTAQIETLEKDSSQTDQVRTELNAEQETLKAASDALEKVIPKLEKKTRSLLGSMPKPLLEEMDPLVRRLPEEGKPVKISASQRLLTVVGILNKIDKFNDSIAMVSEIKQVGDTSAEVTTIYFGLAGAYFANESGSYAGVGSPSPTGWTWTEKSEYAKEIATLIGSYKGTQEAVFANLPISVQ